jgi:demethylmenaquinone methyltransferase/2-methoxy-6-polyprenyl-1,4-benzoquinol methylase
LDRHSHTDKLWTRELLRSPHATDDKADRVRGMFNAIAERYELVNSVCSGGRDRYWRRKAVALAKVTREDRVLDIACGTGDFARAFLAGGAGTIIGCDFAHKMLALAASGPNAAAIQWVEADAQRLPFRGGAFTLTSCAFGVRNFQKLEAGLREMHRVLQPGGRAVILEFTRPGGSLIRRLYEIYSRRIMPAAATLISRDKTGAYRYLPQSVVSFVSAGQMSAALQSAGFAKVQATPLTFGVVTVCVAHRP